MSGVKWGENPEIISKGLPITIVKVREDGYRYPLLRELLHYEHEPRGEIER